MTETKQVKIGKDGFDAFRDVDFYLRLHRHLPDDKCGHSDPFSKCDYREDGIPINFMNDYVEELRKDPEWAKKEQEVQEAVEKHFKETK
jgi:hypothetical protein